MAERLIVRSRSLAALAGTGGRLPAYLLLTGGATPQTTTAEG
ncbi:hypothetical protein [Streptomyces sp. CoH27]|nr:hypothetical protein [Streptomyces sp. CoH27]